MPRTLIGGRQWHNSVSPCIVLILESRTPFSKRKPTCDAHQFNYGDIFFTNVSVFNYQIDFIDGANTFLYSNAPLGAICSVVYTGVKVDTTQMSVESLVRLVHLPSDRHQTYT
jgi:hypothetical protein